MYGAMAYLVTRTSLDQSPVTSWPPAATPRGAGDSRPTSSTTTSGRRPVIDIVKL